MLPQSCSREHSQVAATLSNIPAFTQVTSHSGIPLLSSYPHLGHVFYLVLDTFLSILAQHPLSFLFCVPYNQLFYPLICYLVLACGAS